MGEYLQRFNYYGYEKETYDECRDLIHESNHGHVKIITLWFVLMNAFYYFSASVGLFNTDPRRQSFYLVFMLAALLNLGLMVFGGKKNPVLRVLCMILDLFDYSGRSAHALKRVQRMGIAV